MAELARSAEGAAVETAVEDHAESDTTAQTDHQEVGDAFADAEPVLADDECVDVVLDDRREPGPLVEQVAEWHIAPVGVGAVMDDAVHAVDDSCGADAEPVERLVGDL